MMGTVDFLTKALASCFFLTYPIVAWARQRHWRYTGAGFVGTVAGLLTIKGLPMDHLRGGLVLLGAIGISVAISDHAEVLMGRKDDQRIVIDEWAGYWLSVAFLPQTMRVLLAGFVLFRIVDVWKPLGIHRVGALPGGWGVVMDDLAGGLVVNALLRILPLS